MSTEASNEYDPDYIACDDDTPEMMARDIVNTQLSDLPYERRLAVYRAVVSAIGDWGNVMASVVNESACR
jgi:hypothetical protein